MNTDLLVVWAWEHDADFLRLLCDACTKRQLSVRLAGPKDLGTLPAELHAGNIQAHVAIDRAWDWGGEYARHIDAVKQHIPVLLNDYALVSRAWSKPTIHYALIAHGLHAPHMIVLPSYQSAHELSPVDLTPLGPCFSVKGAHSGGSGVQAPAKTWEDVIRRRVDWPQDETVLQSWIEPGVLQGRRAWFRIFYACGRTFLCWANDRTHEQIPVSPLEEKRWHLDILRAMVMQIAGLCQLNVFSTEITLDEHHLWKIVDYVNEPCDYRLKSLATNGVPDEVVKGVAETIARLGEAAMPVVIQRLTGLTGSDMAQDDFDTTFSVG